MSLLFLGAETLAFSLEYLVGLEIRRYIFYRPLVLPADQHGA